MEKIYNKASYKDSDTKKQNTRTIRQLPINNFNHNWILLEQVKIFRCSMIMIFYNTFVPLINHNFCYNSKSLLLSFLLGYRQLLNSEKSRVA